MSIIRVKYFKELLAVTILCLIILKIILNNVDYSQQNIHELTGITSRQLQEKSSAAPSFQNQIYGFRNENLSMGLSGTKAEKTGEVIVGSLVIDILFIFTNSATNQVLQYYLRRAVETLLTTATKPVRIHLIIDNDGFKIGSKIINEVRMAHRFDTRHLRIVFVPISGLSENVEPIVRVLQTFFTNKKHTYYRDVLFFLSLFLHRLLPGLKNVILMDIDIKVKGDIAELYSHFSKFTDSQVMGLGPELSPVYRHILSLYRNSHPDTKLGSSLKSGGFPGYNSGVLLINVPRLKTSEIMSSYFQYSKLKNRTSYYGFHGHLGDQDLYTLVALDHPELFYTLPCSWNRQLCTWWRYKGYQNVFDEYFECGEETKIAHGNCKTTITEMDR